MDVDVQSASTQISSVAVKESTGGTLYFRAGSLRCVPHLFTPKKVQITCSRFTIYNALYNVMATDALKPYCTLFCLSTNLLHIWSF